MTGISKSTLNNFNPRSREGSDLYCTDSFSADTISIHAPAKGATRSRYALLWSASFQSTLPRRERRSVQKLIGVLVDFNPRSREGSDGIPDGLCPAWMLFQSTLPRRERQYRTFCNSFLHHFNPRSREGSDNTVHFVIAFCIISIHAPAKGATIPYIL